MRYASSPVHTSLANIQYIYILVIYISSHLTLSLIFFFFFQAEDGIRDVAVTWSSDVCSSDLNAIALPLRSAGELPAQWRDALAAYQARPLRVSEGFVVTIPHPGVWVSAQAHEPMQQEQADSHEAAG